MTAVAEYELGQVPRLTVTITVASVNTDPTGLTFQMREPDGTVTAYVYGTDAQLVKSAAGIYYVDWTIDQEGEHRYRWVGTGTAAGADEHRFRVTSSAFYP